MDKSIEIFGLVENRLATVATIEDGTPHATDGGSSSSLHIDKLAGSPTAVNNAVCPWFGTGLVFSSGRSRRRRALISLCSYSPE
jgi:hypothetical protein